MSLFSARSAARAAPLSLRIARVLGGSLLLAAAAHVAVPFWPVPITLQTLVVLGLGAALGPAEAVAAVALWIAEGLAGLPVFSSSIGVAALLGPTGGYIAGFLPGAAITGVAADRGWLRSLPGAVAAFMVADAAIFAAGVGRLAALVGWEKAVAGGLTPFLVGEALKLALLTAAAMLAAGVPVRRR